MRSDPDLLTMKEVAEILRVSPATVSRWSKDDGLLTPIRVGGVVRYHRADVLALIEPSEASA